jgi:hypothetical protein
MSSLAFHPRARLVLRWLVAALVMGGVLAQTAPGRAAPVRDDDSALQPQGLAFSARAGFDGYYKDGSWIPVRISVENNGADLGGSLRISVPRDYGAAETIFTRPVDLPTQSRREIFLYVLPDGVISNLKATLVDRNNRPITSSSVRLVQASTSDLIYGVLAGSPSAFNGLADVDPGSGSAFVAQLEPGDLPSAGRGWQALDVLVVSDVDTGALTPEQRGALEEWVAGGGRLIVAGGPAWQKTAAGLTNLLPVSPTRTRTVSELAGLGNFAAFVAPEGSGVAAEGALTGDAAVLARHGDLPLVVSRRLGFGQVVYLALDPAFAPLKGWDGFEGLFRNILSVSLDRPGWASGFVNWSSARDAVTALPNLELPSAWQICGFLVIYLVVIGPLNYLILKRLKRRELAWVTIPGVVALFSGAAYITGYQLSGTQATVHQLSVVQVWPDAREARLDMLVGLFSPRRSNYSLEFAPGLLARPLPTYGAYSAAPRDLEIEQGDLSRLVNLTTDVASVQAFAAQGKIPAPQFDANLTLGIDPSGALNLKGTVTNLSHLSLSDAVLLAPGGFDALGEFKPGETRNVSLFLGAGRARPVAPNAVAPALLAPPSPAPYYGSNYDRTIDDIFGTSGGYYYNYGDREQYRRYALFLSVYDQYNFGGRGNGVYLAGWTSETPAPARITNRPSTTLDTTLYLVALRSRWGGDTGAQIIPPALMTWSVLDPAQNGTPSPYDYYFYTNDRFSIRFAPTQPLTYDAVESLTLRLTSYGLAGSANLSVDLWDFEGNRWTPLTNPIWGDNPVPEPAQFVGPHGEIHVRVDNPGAYQVNIENLDFTLVVES